MRWAANKFLLSYFFFITLGYVSRTDQIATLGYVSRTNRIAALGYVSRTNHITAFRCLAPITAFGYCFVINYVIESGSRAQRTKLNRTFGPI